MSRYVDKVINLKQKNIKTYIVMWRYALYKIYWCYNDIYFTNK